MYCSNCGQELPPEAKFCSNCGAPVNAGASGARVPGSTRDSDRDWGGYSNVEDSRPSDEEPESYSPPPPESNPTFDGGFADRKPDWEIERERLRQSADDEWSMSSLGPPPPRRRRTWLWVLLGMIALIVIACCTFMGWIAFTDSGTEWAENVIATSEAIATEQAGATPVP